MALRITNQTTLADDEVETVLSAYASAVESAAALRQALKAAFPATKFSVRLDRGTAYGCASVSWTDGPTVKRVQEIVDRFEGEGFDGMTDSSIHYRVKLPDGRESGLRMVNTSRAISQALARLCAAQVAAFWGGVDRVPEIVEGYGDGFAMAPGFDGWALVRADLGGNGNALRDSWFSSIRRCAEDRTEYTHTIDQR